MRKKFNGSYEIGFLKPQCVNILLNMHVDKMNKSNVWLKIIVKVNINTYDEAKKTLDGYLENNK